MSKEISSKSASFAKGGSGKMFGQQHAGVMAPGVTGKVNSSSGGKFAVGGNGKMFGQQHASPQGSGTTGKSSGGGGSTGSGGGRMTKTLKAKFGG